MAPEPQTVAKVELFSVGEGGPGWTLAEGDYNILFLFERDRSVYHPVVIDRIEGEARAGQRFVLHVRFWEDSAGDLAIAGAKFEVWRGRTLGRGVVTEVLPAE